MKSSYKTKMLGVTLLEIMLVLAIIGVVIAMSIRYFQSASSGQRIASGLNAVQGVVGAVENYRMGGGQMSSIDSAKAYMPGGEWPASPWTGKIVTVAGTSNYSITMDVASTACVDFKAKLEANGFTTSACSSGDPVALVINASSK